MSEAYTPTPTPESVRAADPTGQLRLFDLAGRRVLVVGFGDSGHSMAHWLAARGARLRVADTRFDDPGALPGLDALRARCAEVQACAGRFDEAWLADVELLAWSPGLSIEQGDSAAFHQAALARGIPVTGELDLFAQGLAELRDGGYAPKVLAITGTNGKTTTTALAAHLCRSAGVTAQVAGNIRPALLDALREAVDAQTLPQVWVLELSSFQLALSTGFAADAAVILNVSDDHLDWHRSGDSYLAAKQHIFGHDTVAIHHRGDPATRPERAPQRSFGADEPTGIGDFGLLRDGALVWLAQGVAADEPPTGRRRREPVAVMARRLMPADALRVRGLHNQLNALAALALCSTIDIPMARMLHGLRDYRGEPHRCQLIAIVDDVEYYDDSKGTNVGATVAALQGLGKRCRLIAGGDGKGQDFAPLVPVVARHASGVWLIGRDAARLRAALADSGVPLAECASLDEAVRAAADGARAGDAVLLSPACASLDMFRDYVHRAEVFRGAVQALAAERGTTLEAAC
ncbi:MAG: UDP-N-acetylmuramoyl-L-alanine--D-glutamate ligase [Burkholderiaceae bacterium]